MTDPQHLLQQFIEEDRAGGTADPLAYLQRVEGADRSELEALLDGYLARAPRRAFDAEARYGITYRSVPDNKACECGAILRGLKRPQDCKLFGTVCTPENPMGSCMVSSEGACAAHYTYGRYKDAVTT